ncbi:MAG: hypothetical protein ACRDQ5_00825 [Sciscionella sp.]
MSSRWIGPLLGVAVGALATLVGLVVARRSHRRVPVATVVRKRPMEGDGA